MTAFEDLLDSHAPDYIVLAEIQPAEELGVWTAAGGGLTNTYYCAFLSQIATDLTPGGLYRRLDFVRVDGEGLTSRASAALVNANAGSYYHDASAGRLYVHTLGSLPPDSYAFVGAWFTLFFSTGAVDFSDQPLYAPLITGELPTLESELPDPVFGSSKSTDVGALSLLNGDGLFDALSRRYIWRNKAVAFKLGGASLAYSDFTAVAAMRVNNFDVDDEVATLTVESSDTALNSSLPEETFGDDTEITGQHIPLLFGYVQDILPPRTGGQRYEVTTGIMATNSSFSCFIWAVVAVHRVSRANTLLTPVSDYTVEGLFGADGYGLAFEVINPTYGYDEWEIHCTAETGFPDPTGAVANAELTAISLLQEVGETTFSGLSVLDVSSPRLGFYLTEPTPAIDILRRLETTCHASLYKDASGIWRARPLIPDGPADYELDDHDFVAWRAEGDLVGVLNEVRVNYNAQPAAQTASQASSSADRVTHGSETSDRRTIDSYFSDDAASAATLASRLRFGKSAPEARIQFEERGLTLMGATVGQLVAVTRDRGPVARSGRLDGQLLRIVALSKSLGPDTPVVRGVLADIGGQADRIFRLAPAGSTLTWATATDAERAYYGFLSDANGYIDSADPLTKHGKVLY